MSLDVSDAIALAKDLLKTGIDFRPHNPDMAEEFMSRALQICDDLGIDRTLIIEDRALMDEDPVFVGNTPTRPGGGHLIPAPSEDEPLVLSDQTLADQSSQDYADDDLVLGGDRTSAVAEPIEMDVEEETRQTSRQLRDLLQQQARVVQHARESQGMTEAQPRKRSFKLFGRSNDQPFAALQSA